MATGSRLTPKTPGSPSAACPQRGKCTSHTPNPRATDHAADFSSSRFTTPPRNRKSVLTQPNEGDAHKCRHRSIRETPAGGASYAPSCGAPQPTARGATSCSTITTHAARRVPRSTTSSPSPTTRTSRSTPAICGSSACRATPASAPPSVTRHVRAGSAPPTPIAAAGSHPARWMVVPGRDGDRVPPN